MIFLNKTATLIFITFLIAAYSFGQESYNNVPWNATHKLSVNDFAIKTRQLETTSSFAQFSIEYKVNG